MNKNNVKFNNSDEKSIVFIDVDGTMYQEFHNDDNVIIQDMFENNKLVKFVDSILWKINSFDLISNSMAILKLRLYIYSLLSMNYYNEVLLKYKEEYTKFLSMYLSRLNQEKIEKLLKKYRVIILTNNEFSIKEVSKKFDQVIFAKNSKERFNLIKSVSKNCTVEFIVGNNYEDDIKAAKRINAKSIYVGNSVFCKKFKADYVCNTFDKALDILNKL